MTLIKRTPKAIRTSHQREKVDSMVKTLCDYKFQPTDREHELVQLVHHFISVHEKMQDIIWEGGLLKEEQKFNVLRETLNYPSLVGLLDLLWDKLEDQNPNDANKGYRRLVNKFFKEYIDWGARKTAGASIGVSTRKGHHKRLGVPLPRINYKLDNNLRGRLIKSLPVHAMFTFR